MQNLAIMDWAALAAICLITATLAVVWLSPRLPKSGLRTGFFSNGGIDDPVWLFDGFELVDSNTSTRMAAGKPDGCLGWNDLHDLLAARYSGLPAKPDDVRTNGRMIAVSPTDPGAGQIVYEYLDGIIRVQMQAGRGRKTCEGDLSPTLKEEIETLRATVDHAPNPAWRVERSGNISWYNAAYETLYRKTMGHDPVAETPLFSDLHQDKFPGRNIRKSIPESGDGKQLWFDVTVVREEAGCLCYATDINAVVDAEIAQRNFVQTLAKTFAQLSIGLAIFDRNRQLALFNPALIELTSLPADFLTMRPNLLSFFDRLRDQRIMPEPKNYGSWRQQLAALVDAATNGQYVETWSLPSGSVYSVSGRPHPDGAVAFLFEDITAEITLTRRFRSDLELGQSILDQLDDAIAVFTADGTMNFSNAAYHRLWGVDPETSFAQTTVLDATRTWQDTCKASPIWGEIRDFVAIRENRAEWLSQVQLKSGEALMCTVSPIQNGATMVRFTQVAQIAEKPASKQAPLLVKG